MIENPSTKAEQANRTTPEQSRLTMAWYLDPTTGKLAARWVSAAEATVAQRLPIAA